MTHSVGDIWLWGFFIGTVGIAFAIDLYDLIKTAHTPMPVRHALVRSLCWVALSLYFMCALWLYLFFKDGTTVATESATTFLTAYLLEKSLSFDNLFVILMIFHSVNIPEFAQRRVLFWGILGAAVLRMIVIVSGIWLINLFHSLLYLLGLFVLYSGVKMLFQQDQSQDPSKSGLFRWVSRHLPLTHELHEEHFFVRIGSKLWATPLFFALVMIELSDLIFATDSIPAVFAITLDPFIAFTSNLLAVLGLRAMYFILLHASKEIDGLHIGIAWVLILTGVKMLLDRWIHVPSSWMLLMILGILALAGGIGWVKKNRMQSK